MPPYPKLFRMYLSTCVPILVLLEQFEQLLSYFVLCRWTMVEFRVIQPRLQPQAYDATNDMIICQPSIGNYLVDSLHGRVTDNNGM